MSFRINQYLNYNDTGIEHRDSFFENKTEEELSHLFTDILQTGVHGLCFSLYEENQKPGDLISEEQIRRRIEKIKPHTNWVRSFSCTEGNEMIPKIAKEHGLKTLVGAWLGNDKEKNQEEMDALIQLSKDGFVDIAAVGNEVLYRNDLTEEELLEHIQYVKTALPDFKVGYVDAYYEFVQRPQIRELCDVILCNCYPFWEGTSGENSLDHLQNMYQQCREIAQGKEIIIAETGWPTAGETIGNSVPSMLRSEKYFIGTQLWAADENIEVFYFSSFDEAWKKSSEGEIGAHWGIWDAKENLKF